MRWRDDAVRGALASMIGGYRLSQAIYAAATLRIADHLEEAERSVEELAALTGAHAPRWGA